MMSIVEIGELSELIGWKVIPFSFVAYIFVVILEYIWGFSKAYSKMGKSIWYALVLVMTLTGEPKVELIVTMMIAFDMVESFIESKEEKKREPGLKVKRECYYKEKMKERTKKENE